MKRLRNSMLMAGTLLLGAGNLSAMASEGANSWIEQWHVSKHGRNSAMEEARVKAERVDTAYREEKVVPASDAWIENFTRAKMGRGSPTEESRLRTEEAATAYREEAVKLTPSADNRTEEFWRSKLGRPAGKP